MSKKIHMDASAMDFSGKFEPLYDVISPLRVLLLKKRDPESYAAFAALQTHLDKWKEEEGWAEEHRPVLTLLREKFGIKELEEEDLLAVYGAFYTNDFSVRIDNGVDASTGLPLRCSTIRLCFALSSMLSNECTPTTFRCIAGHHDGFRHDIRARRDIAKGEGITLCYEESMLPNLIRKERLLKGKKFECRCRRCLDPTELGSHGSALLCRECQAPMEQTSESESGTERNFKCTGCNGTSKKFAQVRELFLKLRAETDDLLNDPERNNIASYEQFLQDNSSILHPNNLLMVRVRYRLCGMYGRQPGYQVSDLSPVLVERKLRLCEQVLHVLDRIDPGVSVKRGMVLYEMHLPVIMLGQLRLNVNVHSRATAGREMRRGLAALEKAVDLLQYEPEGNSFERQVFRGARESLQPLRQFVEASFPQAEGEEEEEEKK